MHHADPLEDFTQEQIEEATHALLDDWDKPAFSELDLSRAHQLTLRQILALASRPAFQSALKTLQALKELRAPAVERGARQLILDRLCNLARHEPINGAFARELRLAIKQLAELFPQPPTQPPDSRLSRPHTPGDPAPSAPHPAPGAQPPPACSPAQPSNSPMPHTPPNHTPLPSSAIIGAGIAGLTAARTLADHGHTVAVFEKGRGPGGRMSTRREGEHRFDHGAQYFTAKDPAFAQAVASWRRQGIVKPWNPRLAEINPDGFKMKSGGPDRFVGVPAMNAICKHLAQSLRPPSQVRCAVKIESIRRTDQRWQLLQDGGEPLGEFDRLIIAAPPAQAAALMRDPAPHLATQASQAVLEPCWAAMLAFDKPLFDGPPETAIDGAFVNTGPLSWIARDSAKPGREPGERWIAHAGPAWSKANLELDRQSAATLLKQAFFEVVSAIPHARPAAPTLCIAHRWRYALPSKPIEERCLFDPMLGLACCGDWCAGPRVEGAFLSGVASAGRVIPPAQTA